MSKASTIGLTTKAPHYSAFVAKKAAMVAWTHCGAPEFADRRIAKRLGILGALLHLLMPPLRLDLCEGKVVTISTWRVKSQQS